MKKLQLLGMLALMILCSACGPRRVEVSQPSTRLPAEPCIDTFDNFAFSTPDIDGPAQAVILPLEPWQVESTLPEGVGFQAYEIGLIRSVPDGEEIWVNPYIPSEVYTIDEADRYQFMVYRTGAREWQVVRAQTDTSGVFVDRLFVTSEGSIWGHNAWAYDSDHSGVPVLSRYDEASGQFIFDPATLPIPNGQKDSLLYSSQFPVWAEVLLDARDTFWFFVPGDFIYSYAVASGEVAHYSDLSGIENISQSASALNGSVYFRVIKMSKRANQKSGGIYQFDPAANEVKPIEIPKNLRPVVDNFLIDHSDRLWLGVFGWLEPDGTWRQFNPYSEAYIRVNKFVSLWRYYFPPALMLESSDGRIWFGNVRSGEWRTLRSGIAWYDPKTNQGCWFTSEGTNVYEDARHRIWLVAEDGLYSYALATHEVQPLSKP